MSRKFNPSSPLQRAAFACAAMFAAVVTVGSVAALAEHYSETPQLAATGATVLAAR